MTLHLLHCSSNTPRPAPRGTHFAPPDALETFFNANRGNHWARAHSARFRNIKSVSTGVIPLISHPNALRSFWTNLFHALFHRWKTFQKMGTLNSLTTANQLLIHKEIISVCNLSYTRWSYATCVIRVWAVVAYARNLQALCQKSSFCSMNNTVSFYNDLSYSLQSSQILTSAAIIVKQPAEVTFDQHTKLIETQQEFSLS